VELAEPYKPRPVRFLDVAELDGWRIKVYGIAYEGERPEEALVQAALDTARRSLPAPPSTDDRYVHQGRGSNFVFLDWWADENELHHHIWFSSKDAPSALTAAQPGDPIACAWDISVLAHEREAWVAHVLTRFDAPDVEGYLAARMNADV
jgi:hypothetical protein